MYDPLSLGQREQRHAANRGDMNSRRRFLETMQYGAPDRVPYFEEGIRDEVLKVWHSQGLPLNVDVSKLFHSDRREEIQLDLDPDPTLKHWPETRKDLDDLAQALNPDDSKRFPKNWKKQIRAWDHRDHLLMLRVHRGFFQSVGVKEWGRFIDVMYLIADDRQLVMDTLKIHGEFAAKLAERALDQVRVDAAVFSEPIGGNDRPLLSPRLYEEMVLPCYKPLLEVLQRHQVETIIFRTYANAKVLIPTIMKWGFNCLWACEVNHDEMDYRDLKRRFGPELRLIGGIDLDALRKDREAIRKEVEEKLPPLLEQGGYIPVADGRVREDVPFENYRFYRKLLEKMILDTKRI